MRALLSATGYQKDMEPLMRYRPTPLLNVVDKPVLFHILEFLVKQEVKECHLVLSHLPELIEDKLEEGKRWGITLTYHLVKDPEKPFQAMQPLLERWKDEKILFGLGDALPLIKTSALQIATPCTLFCFPSKTWSGWCLLKAKTLAKVPREAGITDIPTFIQPYCRPEKVYPFISTRSFEDLKKTNLKFLNTSYAEPLFPTTAKKVEPGIWLSRAVSLHPTVTIKAPVFIGESCQLKEGCNVGPNTIIENNCVIDANSSIEDSLVCQRSYVGEELVVNNSIIDRNILINLSLQTHIEIHDDFILGELAPPLLQNHLACLLEKGIAALGFLLLSPIYLWQKITCQLQEEEKLLLPAPHSPHKWKSFTWTTFQPKEGTKPTFWQRHFGRIPLLLNILKGEVHFVGVAPRTFEEVQELPEDWKKLYLRSKVGLITLEALDANPTTVSSDDSYASEAFYAAQMGFCFDLQLILRWIKTKLD